MPTRADVFTRGAPPLSAKRLRPRREPTVGESILGTRVHPSNYADATGRILGWAGRGESRYICVANVHMLMEAHDDRTFRDVVNGADFVTSDGMPLVWLLRSRGYRSADRVYGPDLTPAVCKAAAAAGIPVGFYGGEDSVRMAMAARLLEEFPTLKIAYSYSPPFRTLSVEEEAAVVSDINASGTRILFIGLGCPKQERWMARHVGRVDAVMLGVGAAFDFIAGTKRKAPPVIQRLYSISGTVASAAELIHPRAGRQPEPVSREFGC